MSSDSKTQPPPTPRRGRSFLVTVAVGGGAFALGWLYSTFVGCHGA